jgi:hypothetical protein
MRIRVAGFVAIAIASSVGVTAANSAATSKAVTVPAPPTGHVDVALIRFGAGKPRIPIRLRRAGAAAGGTTALVAGVATLPGKHRGRIAIVALVNFPGGNTAAAARRTVGADRRFVVDYLGDAEQYRGKLRGALRSIAARRWTPRIAELPPTSVDRAYRSGRVLLNEVRLLLIGRPDPAFLTTLRPPGLPASPAPPPPPPVTPPPAPAGPSLVRLSSDPFTNASSRHRAQVEPDSFAFGPTVVTAFQSGRFFDGGASDIGFATSNDGGGHWTGGFLPGLTKYDAGGAYDRVSDPTVAYDAKHGVWLIASLAIVEPSVHGVAATVNRSFDGGKTWTAAAAIGTGTNVDKEWIVCDNHPASAFYGHCYAEWDEIADGDRIKLSTSTDGGASWGAVKQTGGNGQGFAGQPLVQPKGRVVVPIVDPGATKLLAFASDDGGATWSTPTQVATISDHEAAGDLRTEPIPSAEIDADGTIYVAWQDCRFRSGCTSNDIVMTSTTEAGYGTWSTVQRVPIDPLSSTVDHFIPGLAVDPATAGSSARLALAYYFYPDAGCTAATCRLDVGFVTSTDGGATWTPPTQIAGPMSLSWLPPTTGGAMVGDYISTSFVGGVPLPFFAVAGPPAPDGTLDEAIATWATPPIG